MADDAPTDEAAESLGRSNNWSEGVLRGTVPGLAAAYHFDKANELRTKANGANGRSKSREFNMKHVQLRRIAGTEEPAKIDKCETLSDKDLDKVTGGAIDSYMYFMAYNQSYLTK